MNSKKILFLLQIKFDTKVKSTKNVKRIFNEIEIETRFPFFFIMRRFLLEWTACSNYFVHLINMIINRRTRIFLL